MTLTSAHAYRYLAGFAKTVNKAAIAEYLPVEEFFKKIQNGVDIIPKSI